MLNAIEVRSLQKQFVADKKAFYALQEITLNIEYGEIYGIIGLSGAGKSTLLRCLSSQEKAFEGSISILGTPLDFSSNTAIKEIRRSIGMIFQHFLLLDSRTALENILLPLELLKEPLQSRLDKAKKLLALVGLEGKADTYPARLSGGEKQRVAIARALTTSPKILFCDEATSALDPRTTQEILELLKELRDTQGITVVLITHEMDVVRQICDRVAVIDRGKIIEEATTVDIFTAPQEPLTKNLVQTTSHDLDFSEMIGSDKCKIVKLHFVGDAAQKPLLSHLISKLQIEINILSGWIDSVQSSSVGCLIISLKAEEKKFDEAIAFFDTHQVRYEVLS